MQPFDPTRPPPSGPPEPVGPEYCYRHASVMTGVHCTRCERPICPDCMVPAPVGYQCPECVAQAKRDFRAADPTRTVRVAAKKATASVTTAILVILAVIFVVEVVLSQNLQPTIEVLFNMGAEVPAAIAMGQTWRLFTAMWLHGSIFHIAMNAYFLWIFGPSVEDRLGKGRFILLYVVSGLAGSTVSYALGSDNFIGVGASGAIFGVFGAFLAMNFRARNRSAMASAQLRQGLIIIVLNAVVSIGMPTIDWRAHLGGLVAGFLAGFAAEGIGPRKSHRVIEAGVLAAILLVSAGLTVWRTDALLQTYGEDELGRATGLSAAPLATDDAPQGAAGRIRSDQGEPG